MFQSDVPISGIYLELLHGNVLRDAGAKRALLANTRRALAVVGRIEVDQLLARREWRGRLSASWFITCNGWQDYTDQLGELLAMSELVYAGQGYCTALASFRSRAAKAYLTAYLDRYLARDDLVYDQRWALGALEYVDATSAEAYRQPNGPWSRWSEATGVKSTASKEIEGLIRLAESLAGDGPALFNL